MKQKKSLAWKERQGLQRKEQATKQKKCVGWQPVSQRDIVFGHIYTGGDTCCVCRCPCAGGQTT